MTREPPNDMAAEQAVLAAVLIDNKALADLPGGFGVDAFHFETHREIWRAMLELEEERRPIDLLTLAAHMGTERKEKAGGIAYVASLPSAGVTAANVRHYAEIVMDRAARRLILHTMGAQMEACYDVAKDVAGIRAGLEVGLSGIQDPRTRPVSVKASAKGLLSDIEAAMDGKQMRAMEFGISALDRRLHVSATDFVIVGARAGEGKSALLWQACRHVAEHIGPAAFVNLEMSHEELGVRALMDIGNLHVSEVRKPSPDVFPVVAKALDKYRSLPITFLPSDEPTEILRHARVLKRKRGLVALFLDYIQLVRLGKEWGDNRDQRIGSLTRSIKRFCMDERIPVIAAAQLRRMDHLRTGRDPRPTLEDLRESGNLEQDANTVLFIYRPGSVQGTDEFNDGDLRTAEFLLGKQRGGAAMLPIKVDAVFEHARFTEAATQPSKKGEQS